MDGMRAFGEDSGNIGHDTGGLSYGVLYAMDTVAECVAIGEPERAKHFSEQDETLMLCLSVPDDDNGTHAGESWLVPLVDISVRQIARNRDIVVTDMASVLSRISMVTSDELDPMLRASWYYPCVPLNKETAVLLRHIATLNEWREASNEEDMSVYEDEDIVTGLLSRDDIAGKSRTLVRKVA